MQGERLPGERGAREFAKRNHKRRVATKRGKTLGQLETAMGVVISRGVVVS